MKFFENGYNRGWEIFTRNGGKARNGGVGFIMGGYCLCPLFQMLSTPPPPPTFLSPPTSPPLFFLLSCLFSWMGDHTTFDVLFSDNINQHMSSLGSLVPEGPGCVFYAIRHHVYFGLTHTICHIYLIRHTQTQKHTHHTQRPVDWHTHINIYLHQLLFAHSSYHY